MTKEEAKELLPIIKAYSEGKIIQTRDTNGWINLDNLAFDCDVTKYRIKPGSKYRPFKNAEECSKAIKEHGSWARNITSGYYHQITNICSAKIHFGNSASAYKDAVDFYVWADDGSPVGVKED